MTTQDDHGPPRIPGHPPDLAWLAKRTEPALEPDLPIVDAHHHLWDHGADLYLFREYRADIAAGGHRIIASVFVECRAMHRADATMEMAPVGETEFVNGVAAMSASGTYGPARLCAGIVGFAALTLGAPVERVLEAHIAAGGGRFRGIRQLATWDPSGIRSMYNRPPPGMLLDTAFRAGFARLQPLGLSYDAWLFHPQLPELEDLARAFPGTTIVINHIGGPLNIGPYADRRQEIFATWKGSMQALARHPNVFVKLGGFGMRYLGFDFAGRPEPASSAELAEAWRPYAETCIETFGPDRCMFESNFPGDKLTCSYGVLWNAFKRLAAGYSGDEKAALFAETARRAYRLHDTRA